MAKQVFRRWDVSQGEMFPPTFQELVPRVTWCTSFAGSLSRTWT